MSDFEGVLEKLSSALFNLEVGAVSDRRVLDKHGREVAVCSSAEFAEAFFTIVLELPEFLTDTGDLEEEAIEQIAQVSDLEEKISSLKEEISDLDDKVEDLKQEISELIEERDSLQLENSVLKEREKPKIERERL